MDPVSVTATRRETTGTPSARRVRREGKIPAVLYGHGEEVVPLAVPPEAVHQLLTQHEYMVDIAYDGRNEQAFLRDVQFDAMSTEVLHVDFTRVAKDEIIEVDIPINVTGHAAGEEEGGIVEQPMHTIGVRCRADSIPEPVGVEVSALAIGDSIAVNQLDLPEGVEPTVDPHTTVVVCVPPQEEPEEEVPPEELGEPELIGAEEEAGEEAEGEGEETEQEEEREEE